MMSAGFTSVCTCRCVNSGLIAGVPWVSISFWRCAFLQPASGMSGISELQLAQRVKEIEVSLGKRRSVAQRALCGRFPSSALVFSLSKVTLKAARHAGNPAYQLNVQTFTEPTSAVLCYFSSSTKEQTWLQAQSLQIQVVVPYLAVSEGYTQVLDKHSLYRSALVTGRGLAVCRSQATVWRQPWCVCVCVRCGHSGGGIFSLPLSLICHTSQILSKPLLVPVEVM